MIGMEQKNEGKKEAGLFANTLEVVQKEQRLFWLSALAFLILYSFLFGLWRIPLIDFGLNRMDAITFLDYLFLLALSILAAIFVTLWRYEHREKISSHSGVGGVAGASTALFSAICPACQGIAVIGLGTTLLNIPTAILVPYLGILKIFSLGLLGLGVVLKAESIHTKKCTFCVDNSPPVQLSKPLIEEMKPLKKTLKHTAAKEHVEKHPKEKTTSHQKVVSASNTVQESQSHTESLPPLEIQKHPEHFLFRSNLLFVSMIILISLLFINQLLIPQAYAHVSWGSGGTVSLGRLEYGAKVTLKPMPLAVGEAPAIAGYQAKVKPLPTISELPQKAATGDAVQDLLNNIIPTGTPWYGQQAQVTFDDPISAQKRWGTYERLQLNPAQQERWNKIVNSFTCDYCCGSPQRPTIITRCGCAHAIAARGMARWLVLNYGESYADEEIYGEMARWYALWYPKGTIERIIQEAQV